MIGFLMTLAFSTSKLKVIAFHSFLCSFNNLGHELQDKLCTNEIKWDEYHRINLYNETNILLSDFSLFLQSVFYAVNSDGQNTAILNNNNQASWLYSDYIAECIIFQLRNVMIGILH